jgi:glutathione S-transferase
LPHLIAASVIEWRKEVLYLYHGSTSVCSIKVRLTLAEKDLDWTGETLDLQRGDQHRPEYAKLNPGEVVPTLSHDGRIVVESTLVIEYLDEAFPDSALMPVEPYARAIARLWMKKIDDYLHASTSTITFATANRKVLSRKTPAELEAHLARVPDPAYRERQRLSITQGLAAPHVAQAVRNFDKYFGEMETTLARQPFLAGEAYSLAEAAATPYVNRADMVGLDGLWARRPHLADWLARVRARPSFPRAITEWLSAADRERFDIPREETRRKVQDILGTA